MAEQNELLYKLVGAPFTRADGTRIERGDVFVPTDEELIRRRHKLQPQFDHQTDFRTAEERRKGRKQRATKAQRLKKEAEAVRKADQMAEENEPPANVPADALKDVDEYHTGNGWYTLPGGVRKQGKKEAQEYLDSLKAGG